MKFVCFQWRGVHVLGWRDRAFQWSEIGWENTLVNIVEGTLNSPRWKTDLRLHKPITECCLWNLVLSAYNQELDYGARSNIFRYVWLHRVANKYWAVNIIICGRVWELLSECCLASGLLEITHWAIEVWDRCRGSCRCNEALRHNHDYSWVWTAFLIFWYTIAKCIGERDNVIGLDECDLAFKYAVLKLAGDESVLW